MHSGSGAIVRQSAAYAALTALPVRIRLGPPRRHGAPSDLKGLRGLAALATPHRADKEAEPHRCAEAILAPSAWDRNFAQVTLGTTTSIPATVPNPQSVPAITLSRPTTSA